MKTTLIQKMLFGLGFYTVFGCGCATPFRPDGWICDEMRVRETNSMEYCSIRKAETIAIDASNSRRTADSAETLQTDPFLAFDE